MCNLNEILIKFMISQGVGAIMALGTGGLGIWGKVLSPIMF